MKLKRYFVENDIQKDAIIIMEGDEFHHLKDVMRARVNDQIVVFNGTKIDGEARILEINKNNAKIVIEEVYENISEPSINVTLFQAVCKGDKLSLITQKITELGATSINVFYSKFTDIKDKTSKLDKLSRVSISASKQCGRSSILSISGVDSFDDMINNAKKCDKVFVAYENADGKTLNDCLTENSDYQNIGLIIGAEGGFSQEEIDKLTQNNFEIVSLGRRILRTETASIVGIASIMFACEK